MKAAELYKEIYHKDWYGYLPIAQNGLMHYLMLDGGQTKIKYFSLFNLMEDRKNYPDDVELKSMFDLASSLVSFMRRESSYKWIFCEGGDDKKYLQVMLEGYKNVFIIPLGGCGNVIKLYQILHGFMSEKSEEAKADGIEGTKQDVTIDELSIMRWSLPNRKCRL